MNEGTHFEKAIIIVSARGIKHNQDIAFLCDAL
jgi:hypothetical protein